MANRILLVMMFLLASQFILTACGEFAGESEDPVELCEDLLDTYCDKQSNQCSSLTTYSECISDSHQLIDCSEVVSVRDTYDRCIDDIDSAECSEMYELPASCDGVLLTH